jgi:outer membrane murein-binding lipoprotein Lpp
MTLTKDDLREIGKLINGAIEASETRVLAVINDLANDMDERFEGVDRRFARMEMKSDKFQKETNERLDRLETKVDRLQNQMDGLSGDYKTLCDEEAANANFNARADDRLDDHESRISALEQAGGAAA